MNSNHIVELTLLALSGFILYKSPPWAGTFVSPARVSIPLLLVETDVLLGKESAAGLEAISHVEKNY